MRPTDFAYAFARLMYNQLTCRRRADQANGPALSMQMIPPPSERNNKRGRGRGLDENGLGEADHFEVSTDEDTDDAWKDNRYPNNDR